MKTVKLEGVKPIKRLIDLVDKIPELCISKDRIVSVDSNLLIIYDFENNDIQFPANRVDDSWYEKNTLLNKDLLWKAIEDEVGYITQDQFCDILEQHLFLKAKQKIEMVMPQIKEMSPNAKVIEPSELNVIIVESDGHPIFKYEKCKFTLYRNSKYTWKDEVKLILQNEGMNNETN